MLFGRQIQFNTVFYMLFLAIKILFLIKLTSLVHKIIMKRIKIVKYQELRVKHNIENTVFEYI